MRTWEKGLKRAAAIFLTTVLVGNTTDFTAFAVEETKAVQTVTDTIIPETELPDNEELFAGYVDKKFYGGISLYGISAREELGTLGQSLYDYLKTHIESVAAGTTESAVFTVDYTTLLSWNATTTFQTTDTNQAFSSFLEQFEVSKVIDALLHDCPYELYWFDKTEGITENASLSTGNTCTIYSVNFMFQVAGTYQADNYDQEVPAVNTTKTAAASTAVTNANAVVTENENKSDYEKLIVYRDYICDVVSYNSEAAAGSYTGGYGDPWQLIYVFDGDSNTNVVCEGYSKAFQYLCDLTVFQEDVYCYTVTGTMSGASGAGGHMWNIVTMKDGKNYLVDVTNSDAGSAGAKGGLFLAGTTGSMNSGYTFSPTSGSSVRYVYDTDTIGLWDSSVLTLAETDYVPASTYEVTFDGSSVTSNGAVTAASDSDYTATLTVDKGYLLPDSIAVMVGDITLNADTDYEYSQSTGILTIHKAAITGNITITATAVQNLEFVDDKISVTVSDITYGETPDPQGSFEGDGTGTWTYTYSEDGINFVELSELKNTSGYLDKGSYTVKATYENETQIGSKTTTFSVNEKRLSVLVDASLVTKTYDGNTSVTIQPVLNLNGAIANEEPVLNTSGITYVYDNQNAGTDKEIIVSGIALTSDAINGNYSVSPTAIGTGAGITKAPVTVTANAQTKIYGAEEPILTYTATGLAAGEQLVGELQRSAGNDVGTYMIYQGTLNNENNTNYNITFQSANFTINKATPYVAAAPYAMEIFYGEALSDSGLTGGTVQYGNGAGEAGSMESVLGSFTWKDGTIRPVVADNNNTKYTVIFTPEDTANYNVVEIAVTLPVKKAAVAPNMPETTMNVANSCKKISDVSLPEGWVWQEGNVALEIGTPVSTTAVYNGTDKGNYETETVIILITRATCEHKLEIRNVKEATCKEAGYTGDTYCKLCEEKITSGEEIEKLTTHTWNEGEVTKEATCTESGEKTYTCTVCETTKTEEIEKKNHTGGSATCAKKAVCDICEQEYGELDKTNHGELELRNAKEATCAEAGYTGDTYCKLCGDKTVFGEEIEKLTTHTWDEGEVTKEATCTEVGEKTYTCTVCETTKTEEIEKKNHTGGSATCAKKAVCDICEQEYGELDETSHGELEFRNAKEATCAEAGYTGDTYCKICGDKTVSGKEIGKLTTHTWNEGEVTKEATCTEVGEKTYTCTVCETTKTEEIEKKNHTGGSATCAKKAVCDICEQEYGELDKTNHGKLELRNEKEATCAEAGYTGDTYCKDCGTKTASGKEIAKLTTHTWDQGIVTKESNAVENGVKTYTCTVCKATKTEEINVLEVPKKNTILTDEKNQAKYKVIVSAVENATVEYVGVVNQDTKTITIPETITIDGIVYKVTGIAKSAFKNNKKITKVIIGSNIKTIGSNAFSGCAKLKTVTIGKNVTTIGNKAFYKCTALTKITIPSKVATVGKQSFSGCKKLKTITIKTNKLTTKAVGSKAFQGIYKKAVIKVPKSKVKTYQSMLKKKGIGKEVKVKK